MHPLLFCIMLYLASCKPGVPLVLSLLPATFCCRITDQQLVAAECIVDGRQLIVGQSRVQTDRELWSTLLILT